MTTENRNRHLVESAVAVGNIQARLDFNGDLGWKIIQIVYAGTTYTLVWQRVEQVTV